jgi:hypothetical protein
MPLARVLYGGHTLRLLANTSRAAAYSQVLQNKRDTLPPAPLVITHTHTHTHTQVLQNMFRGSSLYSSAAEGDDVGGGGERQRVLSRSAGGGGGVTLALGDGHWLALAAVEAGAERVVDVESTPHALRMASLCFAAANLPPSRVRAWQVGVCVGVLVGGWVGSLSLSLSLCVPRIALTLLRQGRLTIFFFLTSSVP